MARSCHSKQSGLKDKLPTHLVGEELEEHDDEFSFYTIQDARANYACTGPLHVTLNINRKPTVIEIDTGVSVSLMAEINFNQIAAKLHELPMNLCIYSGEKFNVVGEAICNVDYAGKLYVLSLVVIAGNGPTLISCNVFHFLVKLFPAYSLGQQPTFSGFTSIYVVRCSQISWALCKVAKQAFTLILVFH